MALVGTYEIMTLLVMVAAFAGFTFGMKLPVGVALIISSIIGAIVGNAFLPVMDLVRHFAEGTFAYMDAIMTIACATIFMKFIERSGLLGTLANSMIRAFGRFPVVLLAAITVLIMFPGMMTGSSTAAVLTTGAMMCPVLLHLGIPRPQTGAIIAMCALLGMAAPPVSIPALIIGAGIDLPYVGLDLPLLVLTVPLALACSWALGLPHCWKTKLDKGDDSDLPQSVYREHGLKLFIPLVVTLGLLIAERYMGGAVQLGLPLIFLIGAGLALVTGHRFGPSGAARHAMADVLPVLAILVGVGVFIQVMTLTGGRGEVVVQTMQLPRGWTGLYPAMGISLPIFGAVSSFGAASILGVPFTLALPMDGSTIIINVAAIVVIVALGDLMPPTALASIFAAKVAGVEPYTKLLKYCALPALVVIIVSLLFVDNAAWLGRLLVRF